AHATDASAVLLACWQTLLWRLTAESEIVVGVTCDGRTYEGQEEALGLFAKSVPLACPLKEDLLIGEVIKRAGESLSELPKWQEYFSWTQLLELTVNTASTFFPISYEFDDQTGRIDFDDQTERVPTQEIG